MLSFTLPSGENITAKVVTEIARARGCTMQQVHDLNANCELTLKEIDIAMERAVAIDHARQAIVYDKVMKEEAEERANQEALADERWREKLHYGLREIFERTLETAEYIGETVQENVAEELPEIPNLSANPDSVVVYRGATSRWELVDHYLASDQDLADLLLTQKIIEKAITVAKQNSSWGL